MKEKIGIVLLIIVFAILLIASNTFLNKKSEEKVGMSENNNNNLNYENNIEQDEVYLEEEKNMEENVLEVTSENFESEVLKSDKKVLIDFYADWCGPCKRLSPIVESASKEVTDAKFVKLNIDEAQDIAIKYDVMSIPTLVVMKDGKEINRSVGLISKQEVIDLLK